MGVCGINVERGRAIRGCKFVEFPYTTGGCKFEAVGDNRVGGMDGVRRNDALGFFACCSIWGRFLAVIFVRHSGMKRSCLDYSAIKFNAPL